MHYFKWGFVIVVVLGLAAFLHYSLPQRDIVRITETDVTRMDTGSTADGAMITRDVRFIFGKYPDGGEMEYRNEDTGWGFPWYFKFDSARLANKASDLKSTADNPRWVVVRHYGWRIPWLDMFPNAISIRPAEGRDEALYPWFNGIFIALLVTAVLVVRRMILIFRERHVDPVVDAIDEEIDQSSAWWRRTLRRLRGSKR